MQYYNQAGSRICLIYMLQLVIRTSKKSIKSRMAINVYVEICNFYQFSFLNKILLLYKEYSSGLEMSCIKFSDKVAFSQYFMRIQIQLYCY